MNRHRRPPEDHRWYQDPMWLFLLAVVISSLVYALVRFGPWR